MTPNKPLQPARGDAVVSARSYGLLYFVVRAWLNSCRLAASHILKFFRFFPLFSLCAATSGCFPYHYTIRPGLSGTVVAPESNTPLAGAAISFGGTNTTAVAFSTEDGSFLVPPKRRWGIWIIPQDVFAMSWSVRVYHPGYETNFTQFRFAASATGKDATVHLGVVSLKPVSP